MELIGLTKEEKIYFDKIANLCDTYFKKAIQQKPFLSNDLLRLQIPLIFDHLRENQFEGLSNYKTDYAPYMQQECSCFIQDKENISVHFTIYKAYIIQPMRYDWTYNLTEIRKDKV